MELTRQIEELILGVGGEEMLRRVRENERTKLNICASFANFDDSTIPGENTKAGGVPFQNCSDTEIG